MFSPARDITVAETIEGPVVVAREGARDSNPKQVFIGFDPGRGAMKYQLATPLLIANILRWITPGAFRQWEFQAGTVGTVNVPVEKDAKSVDIHVLNSVSYPAFRRRREPAVILLRSCGNLMLAVGNLETVYSLTLPDVGEVPWRVPASVLKGVPRPLLGRCSPRSVAWAGAAGWNRAAGRLASFRAHRAFRLRASRAMAPLIQWRKAS